MKRSKTEKIKKLGFGVLMLSVLVVTAHVATSYACGMEKPDKTAREVVAETEV